MNKKLKAIALVSTGLDSQLSVKIIHDLGIDVLGLHCVFRFDPFIKEDQEQIDALFKSLGVRVQTVDLTEAFLSVLLDPPHGYGSNFNPCIDCKVFMFRYAKQFMEENGFAFLVTGEVAGQRPMTQKTPMMVHIERNAGLEGWVVRPLSAKLLKPTLPEMKGWIDREKLLDISGRGRKGQFELVKKYGIKEFNTPAGGCILTNPQFSQRARALLDHIPKNEVTVEDLQLLRLGRHFWLDHDVHVMIGRHEQDNEMLEKYQTDFWVFEAKNIQGPLSLARNVKTQQHIEDIAGMVARYGAGKYHDSVLIAYQDPKGKAGEISVTPMADEIMKNWRV